MLQLYFYHCLITIHANKEVSQRLERDFSYFTTPQTYTHELSIVVEDTTPDFSEIQGAFLFRHFKGNVYGWRDQRWIQYDDTLVVFDAIKQKGRIVTTNVEMAYHYTYYMIIAKIGEYLDEAGLHRFHSLGVSIGGVCSLFSMPISGGKTTLGLELMKHEEVILYSEDTPLINAQGKIHPFPVRLSLREGYKAIIPDKWKRVKNDPIFGKKILVDLAFYGRERLGEEPKKIAYVFWGHKTTKDTPCVRQINFFRSLYLIMFYLGIGKDCPQRSELFLRLSLRGVWTLSKICFRRFWTAFWLWKSSRSFDFYMTTDIAKNVEFLKDFHQKH